MKPSREPTAMGLRMARTTHRNLLCNLSGIQSRMDKDFKGVALTRFCAEHLSPAVSISKEAQAFLEAMSRISDHRQKMEVMVAMLRLLNKEDM